MPRLRFAFLGLILSLCTGSVAAQITPIQLLHQTAATYRALSSYEFNVTVHTRLGEKLTEQRFMESGVRPGKFRIEDADAHGELRVADGQNQWTLNRASNEFSKNPVGADTASPITDLENIDQNVSSAEFSREELFAVDGKQVLVVVVSVERSRWPQGTLKGANLAMYRIDESNFRVYKANTYSANDSQIVLYSILKWNQPVADESFAFMPPASARSVATVRQQAAAVQPLVGSQAPDFTLQDSAGHEVKLHDLLGKVVIVDFWASWCGPCQAQMPELQRISQQLSGQGLVVLGLNTGETPDDVVKFTQRKSYTFTVLLGAEPDVSAKYFVEGLPSTFVVDRRGRITYASIGSEPPDRLRAAVAAALRN